MPVGENQLEWSMPDAGLINPGWSWSTTGDLEIIDDSLILTRSGSSRVYGTIILNLPNDAAPSYHTFIEQSTQSTDHILQFSLEVLQIYRAELTITSPIEQPYEVEVEEEVLVMIKLENPGNGFDTFRLSSELITNLNNDEEFEFNYIIIATHADQALQIINKPTNNEKEIISKFDYTKNRAYLHSDRSMMPKNNKTWSSWNFIKSEKANSNFTLTLSLIHI